MKLYRYRSIASALMELDSGSFYFAESKELNDPIEGYCKIFWQGDCPVWQGLLKNFVCSLFYSLQSYLLMARNFSGRKNLQDFQKQPVINFNLFDSSPLNKIFCELSEKFLHEDSAELKLCGKELGAVDKV